MKTKTKFQPEHLNQNLIARNGVSPSSQLELCTLYDKLEELIEEGNATLSVEENRRIANEVEQLEFKLQELWGFGRSQMHHRYWSRLDICLCNADSLDNRDNWGYRRTVMMKCPIHGHHS